ncbi:MAG: vitamin B12 dependent-methionine synthase activation domain-containing protein [Bacillota bacterium]|nr:vitamin B12 dependent-methionine synthase activation domain-containing protein [Bacillota bacterium]
MNIKLTGPIDRTAWLAALHAKGEAQERLAADLEEGERLLKAAARPKAVYKTMKASDILMPDTLHDSVKSISLEKHLAGCHSAALMAVTLGVEVDELIRRTQVTDMALAVIIDTGASVMVEQLADECEKYIEGSYRTSRFSPGYGDWPITEQARLLRYLDAGKAIGLTATRDSLMIPRKSITAVIGISDRPVSGRLATCDECVLKDKCELKKEGKYCGSKL